MFFESIASFLHDILFFLGYVAGRSSFPKPLSETEERDLLAQACDGDESARQTLIEHNLRLVAHVVKKFSNTRLEQDDLISIGTIGLIKAVNTYKTDYNTKLATYAARCVENEVLMFIRSTKKLEHEVSLNEPVGVDREGNELTNLDILGSQPDAVIDEVYQKIELEKVYRIAQTDLAPREKLVFTMRYGLVDGRCYAQREIAKTLGISRSYVSRIEKKALEKLRKHFEKKRYKRNEQDTPQK